MFSAGGYSYPLKDKESDEKMKKWQKILLTVAICEVFGLTTLALFFWGGSLLGHVKSPSPILIVSMISCFFTLGICHELLVLAPDALIPAAFLIQFVIYLIIGLVISIVVCRKTKPVKHQTTPFDSAGN